PVATVAQRREAIAGWIYAPVRAIDLMSPLTVSSDLRFRIFDGIPASGAQLFEAGEWTDHDARAVGDVRRIALFGRTWSLEIGSPRTGAVIRRESQIVFFAGLLISGLMATVMIALGSTRRRAHMLADSMTRALRESESRVRSIVDNIADAVITFPSGGSVEAFNLTAEKLFGFSPSEIVGRNVESLLPRIRDAEPTGAAVESVARRRDGSEVPVELALTSFKSGERDVSIAIVRDISERAAVQERLRASEERYRLFFESNPLPSFVWDIATFSILGVNEAASAIYGYSREEFLKMTVLDIRPLEDVPRFMETAAETRPMAFRAGVWRHVRKDGSIIEVDITSQDVQFLGRAARLVVCKDVTDDLAAERKIRESEDRFRDLFENSNDLILSVDRHGRFVFANRAWLRTLGYTAEELRGLVIGDLAHPDCLENCKEILRRVMAGQWINNAEVTFVAKDGRRVVAEGNISGRRDEGGEVISARAIFRDVTERKRAEKELADTLLSLSTVLSSATEIAIIATDLTGMVTVFNSGAERILGFTAAEVIGKQSAYVFHLESELAELREEMTRELGREVRDFDDLMSRARGGGWEREWTYVRKDGEQRRVNLTVTARRDAGGSVIGYLHVAKDVTVQKAVEHALRESEDRLKLMIDNADDIIYRVDTKGRFSFLNATATRLSGFPREVLLGSYYLDFIRPDYRPVTRELYIRQLQERIPNTYHEFPGITADGREVWLGQKVQPFFEHGEIAGFQAVARDITERKRAEDQLRHQLSYTTAIMDSLGEGLCTTDKDGRVTSINPAAEEMLGWGAADLIGQPFHDLVAIHRSGGPRVLASRSPLREALRTARTVRSDEYLLARRDGRLFAVSYTSSPIVVGGEVTGAVLAFRDITEGKKLEEALAQARDAAVQSARLKSEFLANMSHEIRTPMNGVIGMVGLLLGTELSSEQRELAQTVRSSADSLLTIVNDILDFSKIEAGKLSFETSDFDLGTTVEGAVELLAEQARVKKIEVVSLVYSDVPRALRGDAGRLRQVLTNLIGNAVKFTDHGEIVVRVQREGETDTHVVVRISVSDTGMGIDPAAQPRLFTPFTQADGSTTRRYGGTGLGLAICKQLVSMMNGVIGVESERGLGSTFWFTAEFEKQRNPADADRRLAGRRILVVDDSESGRRVFSQQLTSWGMRAQAVTTGWEGTEELKAAVRRGSPYDICVVDMQTPEMDGLHFAAAVGRDRDLQAIPLVLVTSVGKRGDVEGYRSAGFKAVLIKPVKQSFLFETLLELLASGKEERVRPAEAPSVAASATSSPRKKLRVLVAEDNHINQKVALGQLHKLGYPADAVANGLEVLEALERIPYGLVLMDCQMPEMDGYEATAQIRRRERGERRIPIIAMTANAMEGDRERCLDAGMDDYLAKPITERDLGNAIRRWDDELNGSEPAPAAPSLEATIDRDALRGIRELGPNGGDLLDELITIFLEESPSRMTALRLAIDEGDANSAWRTAHTLKSGCSNLGATKMVALCDAIERQARGGSIENLSSLAFELDAELLRVSNALQRERVSST
ncbi:MAG TPA: PAS domain S-box protein, partial [Thermoanaerobaculia bacterium]|nr:PAS domain S-box protein [Thermoanaerobaculia bacterium]